MPKKYVCGRGSAPDPAGWAYSAPPDPLAANGGGPPWRGGKRRGGVGKGKGYPPLNENSGYGFGWRYNAVLHATAWLIYSKQNYEHITPLLVELHWFSVSDCIQFKLAVLIFRCLHGTAPSYLADQLQPVAALESCRRLRSSASARLDIPRAPRTTIGDRAFCVAGPHVWNSLSSSTQNAPSLLVLRRLLKCDLYRRCYGSELC